MIFQFSFFYQESVKVCQIPLQSLPEFDKSSQTLVKTLTVVYIVFAADRVLTERRKKKSVNLKW